MTGKKSKGLFINGVLDSLTPAVPLNLEVDGRNRLLACLRMNIVWIKSIYIHRVLGAGCASIMESVTLLSLHVTSVL